MAERKSENDDTEKISPSSIVRAGGSLVSCNLDDDAIVLHLESERYFGLEGVGAFIWELLQQPRTVEELKQAVLKEYDVEPDRCEADLLSFLNDLARKKLIKVENERSSEIFPPSRS